MGSQDIQTRRTPRGLDCVERPPVPGSSRCVPTEHAELIELRASVAQLGETVGQLQHALASRITIEQAKGVLAERYRLAVPEAFELLRQASRSARLSVHSVARSVVEEGERTPEPILAILRSPWGRVHLGPPLDVSRGRNA